MRLLGILFRMPVRTKEISPDVFMEYRLIQIFCGYSREAVFRGSTGVGGELYWERWEWGTMEFIFEFHSSFPKFSRRFNQDILCQKSGGWQSLIFCS